MRFYWAVVAFLPYLVLCKKQKTSVVRLTAGQPDATKKEKAGKRTLSSCHHYLFLFTQHSVARPSRSPEHFSICRCWLQFARASVAYLTCGPARMSKICSILAGWQEDQEYRHGLLLGISKHDIQTSTSIMLYSTLIVLLVVAAQPFSWGFCHPARNARTWKSQWRRQIGTVQHLRTPWFDDQQQVFEVWWMVSRNCCCLHERQLRGSREPRGKSSLGALMLIWRSTRR